MYSPDLRNQIRQFLQEGWQNKSHPDGFHVRRPDIEAIGPDPDAAARTFVGMRGFYWQGEYIGSEERNWTGAWVRKLWAGSTAGCMMI